MSHNNIAVKRYLTVLDVGRMVTVGKHKRDVPTVIERLLYKAQKENGRHEFRRENNDLKMYIIIIHRITIILYIVYLRCNMFITPVRQTFRNLKIRIILPP